MTTTKENVNETTIKLTIVGEKAELTKIKEHVLNEVAQNSRATIPGFRKGKVPIALLEKQLDPEIVQAEFLEHAVNDLYIKAADQEKLRVASQPKVEVKKFVPYDTLEFEAEVEVIGDIKLPDYKKVNVEKKKTSVTATDVNDVLKQLTLRASEKKEVTRPSKDGDEIVIDFKGIDAKTKDPIAGADGKEYPLTIGSNTFIPGFEPELIGLSEGEEKSFDITFPKDYGVKNLQNKKVTFTVKVHKVNGVTEPKLDDAFAKTVGPFKTLDELKADIKKQLTLEREQEAERDYENELITKIAENTKVAIPASVIDDQVERLEQEEKQNLIYRGQTWEEHLEAEGLTEEEHREKNREPAELRVKAGLVLAEIAEKENIVIEPDELEHQVSHLKEQYSDSQMQQQLDSPEGRRDIVSRMLSQKTISRVKELNS
jgi:trigger factor